MVKTTTVYKIREIENITINCFRLTCPGIIQSVAFSTGAVNQITNRSTVEIAPDAGVAEATKKPMLIPKDIKAETITRFKCRSSFMFLYFVLSIWRNCPDYFLEKEKVQK
jgi:hypothetical protein